MVYIAESARRHGVSDDDMVHAYRNAIRVHDLDGFEMAIGPDQSARLLEIGIVDRGRGPMIVHAMPARDRFVR
jgi:hypothetical protein